MTWGDAVAVLGGFVTGVLSGTIGIGGGLVFVPFMTVGYGYPQAIAQGTSLAAIAPTALVGGITHIRQGNVVRQAAAWMGGGGVVGAALGALLAVEAPGSILARIFGAFLLFSAWRIGWGALRPSASSAPQAPQG